VRVKSVGRRNAYAVFEHLDYTAWPILEAMIDIGTTI
jgi:hypothetical protein